MIEVVFYEAIILIIYTYFIFPLILFIINFLSKTKHTVYCPNSGCQSVAIVCAMFNEERVVRDKINNFYKINYDNMKLYIGSDGSNDNTNSILDEYSKDENIKIFKFQRRGKVHAINDLMKETTEDIIIFTDANSMFEHNAVLNLVGHFIDPKIGVVCGNLKLLNDGQVTGEGLYWRYEKWIKKLESEMDCVIGANGSIYAIRRSLLQKLPANCINDDFTNSMQVVAKGFGIKFAEDAITYEENNHDDSVEFNRHIRDGAGHYRAIIHLYRLLNPFRYKVFFLYVSHRLIRWMVPFFLIIAIFLPWFIQLDSLGYTILFCQIAFYLFAFVGYITKTKIKVFYIPMYFLYINIALLIGFFRNILGVQKVTWNSTTRCPL